MVEAEISWAGRTRGVEGGGIQRLGITDRLSFLDPVGTQEEMEVRVTCELAPTFGQADRAPPSGPLAHDHNPADHAWTLRSTPVVRSSRSSRRAT